MVNEIRTIPPMLTRTEWNALMEHGLRKPATYIICKSGSYCMAIQGDGPSGAGSIAYGGPEYIGGGASAASVFQSILDNAPNGSSIKVNYGGYDFGSTKLTFPNGKKNIRFIGDGWLGKDYATDGFNGTHLKTSNEVMFDNAYTNNIRSIYGIQFEQMKFEGPATGTSTGFDIYNADGYVFDHCTFFNFGTSLKSNFIGSSVAEQPGLGPITRCLFAQGGTRYIYFAKNTQVYIQHNIFQSFGNFTNHIYGLDSDKIEIHGNEFNTTSNTGSFTEFIKVEHGDASFGSSGWRIMDNWAYREVENMYWIRTAGAETIPSIVSRNNTLYHGYTPTLKTDPGPYVLGSETLHAIQSNDFVMPPCNDPVVDMSDYTAGTAYQNKWAPVTLHIKVNVPDPDYVNFQLGRTTGSLWTISTTQCLSGGGDFYTVTLEVPVMFYWKVICSGSATQESIVGVYH